MAYRQVRRGSIPKARGHGEPRAALDRRRNPRCKLPGEAARAGAPGTRGRAAQRDTSAYVEETIGAAAFTGERFEVASTGSAQCESKRIVTEQREHRRSEAARIVSLHEQTRLPVED
jgi:hypothetical protein